MHWKFLNWQDFLIFPKDLNLTNIFIQQSYKFALKINLSLQKLCKKWHGKILTTSILQGVK